MGVFVGGSGGSYEQSTNLMISREGAEKSGFGEELARQKSETQALRQQLAEMTAAYHRALQKLASGAGEPAEQGEQEEQGEQGEQEELALAARHAGIAVEGRRVTNAGSEYEVRWALLGPALSAEKNTFLRVKVRRLSWLALGFCHKEQVERRRFSRLNGSGEHGAFVMDSSGWFYAHQHPSSNYRPLGFLLREGDEIALLYTPREATVCLINPHTWQKCEVSLRAPEQPLYACLACSRETDVEILEYLP